MVDECLDEVNERSTSKVRVDFYDENGAPVTPSAATYRIDDQKLRTVILDMTSIGSLAATVYLEVTPTQNRILKKRSTSEIRTVTVEFDYGGSKHGTSQYRYRVLNLYGVNPFGSPSMSPSSSASPST